MGKRLLKFITRSWEEEPGTAPPSLRFLPPIFFDLLSFGLLIALIYYGYLYLAGA